jgi:prepilin-type N-terminal cleavage/methylation domain-containing protein
MNMKNTTTSSSKGFTLVELIVVIVILAILATIAFLSFSSQSASARDSKRKTDLSNIAAKINIANANGSALTSFVTSVDGLIS